MAKKSTTKSAVTTADKKAGDKPEQAVLSTASEKEPTPARIGASESTADDVKSSVGNAPEIKLSSDAPAAEPVANLTDKPVEAGTTDKAESPESGVAAAVANARRNPLLNWLSSRAAMIAIAAGVGALIGTTVSNGIGYTIAVASADRGAGETTRALRASVGQLTAEIASLKALVAGGDSADGIILSDAPRLLGGADSARTPTAPKLAAVSDTPAAVSGEITGSIAPQSTPVAKGWTLWRVRNGRALVQGESGYFEVAPGSRLPGLGMVQRIVRRGNDWSVETRNGVILPRGG